MIFSFLLICCSAEESVVVVLLANRAREKKQDVFILSAQCSFLKKHKHMFYVR